MGDWRAGMPAFSLPGGPALAGSRTGSAQRLFIPAAHTVALHEREKQGLRANSAAAWVNAGVRLLLLRVHKLPCSLRHNLRLACLLQTCLAVLCVYACLPFCLLC